MSNPLKPVTDRYQPRTNTERKLCKRLASAISKGDAEAEERARKTLVFLQEGPPIPSTPKEARKIKRATRKPVYTMSFGDAGMSVDSDGKLITDSTISGAISKGYAAVKRAFTNQQQTSTKRAR